MARFLKFNIQTKIILGHLPLILVMILIAFFALIWLKEANNISKNVIESDIVLIEAADDMTNALLAQESYGRRYIILQSPEMLDLFWQRGRDFDALVSKICNLPEQKHIPGEKISVLHAEFNHLYIEWIKHIRHPSKPLAKEFDEKIKSKLDELIAIIQTMVSDVKQSQRQKILRSGSIGLKAFRTMVVFSSLGILLGVAAVFLINRNISRSIHQLKLSTKEISEGKFDHVPDVKTQDELGELAKAFNEMTYRLARLEEMYLDASPLTRLPGGIAIESVLKKRLRKHRPVAFCLIDLDNFKAFNDRYGYAKGNDVIVTTARIIQSAIEENGTDNDFVGHIGGDDFAIITSPEKYAAVCKTVINAFDQKVIEFYDPKDRARGYILSKTRQGQDVKFPIMTVSIAVVTTDGKRQLNHIEIGEIAAELKKHAKSMAGSVYMVNRRTKIQIETTRILRPNFSQDPE